MNHDFQGEHCLSILREILEHLKARTVLLVRGRNAYKHCGAEAAIAPLLKGKRLHTFMDFEVDPNLHDVVKGVDVFRIATPDVILAVGGGSVIDMAKLINVMAGQDHAPALVVKGERPIRGCARPLIAVPTTAGTGSEATRFAVCYIGDQKYSVSHSAMRPEYALVDPTLTYSLPPMLTAVTGIDALAQAIESYWAMGATDESRTYSRDAMGKIIESLPEAVNRGTPEARSAMALGAHSSGKAIDIAKTTGPHAMSYAITKQFDIPHGHAVALTLGRFFELNEHHASRFRGIGGVEGFKTWMQPLYVLLGCESARQCRERWHRLMHDVGLETDFGKLGIRTERDRRLLVESVNLERLSNHPVALDPPALATLFTIAPTASAGSPHNTKPC